MQKTSSIQSIVLVALFTALTTVGTSIMIPLPTGAFVHLGNAVLLLSVLLLGYFKGALAGGLGFFIFDVLHGYITEAPYFILESFIVGAAAYGGMLLFKKDPTKLWQVIIIGIFTGIAKLIMTQIKNTVMLMIGGAHLQPAFIGAATKLPATLINVSLTVLIVALVYFPLKSAMKHTFKQTFA